MWEVKVRDCPPGTIIGHHKMYHNFGLWAAANRFVWRMWWEAVLVMKFDSLLGGLRDKYWALQSVSNCLKVEPQAAAKRICVAFNTRSQIWLPPLQKVAIRHSPEAGFLLLKLICMVLVNIVSSGNILRLLVASLKPDVVWNDSLTASIATGKYLWLRFSLPSLLSYVGVLGSRRLRIHPIWISIYIHPIWISIYIHPIWISIYIHPIWISIYIPLELAFIWCCLAAKFLKLNITKWNGWRR